MSDDALRAWQFYIDDMIGFADKVIAYTNGLDQEPVYPERAELRRHTPQP